MTVSEDVEKAIDLLSSVQELLEELETSREVEHIDPEVLTSHELKHVRRELDMPIEELEQICRRLQGDRS